MSLYKILFGLALTLFLTSCSSGKFYSISGNNTLQSNIKTFDIKEIKIPFKKDNKSITIIKMMKDEIHQELEKKGFKYDNTNPDIVIDGKLLYIDEGNAALRYFIGFGAGKAEVKFEFKLSTTEDANVSVKGKGIGTLNMGAFGGNMKIMCDKIAKDMARQMKSGQFK